MTQTAAAQQVGVSQPTFCDWLNGKKKPKVTNLKKLARLIGKRPQDLYVELHLGG